MGSFPTAPFLSPGPQLGPQDTAETLHPAHSSPLHTDRPGLGGDRVGQEGVTALPGKSRAQPGRRVGSTAHAGAQHPAADPSSTPQERGGWLEVLERAAYHLGGLSTLPTDLTSLLLCLAPYLGSVVGCETRPWP